jgi:hypothetical protein
MVQLPHCGVATKFSAISKGDAIIKFEITDCTTFGAFLQQMHNFWSCFLTDVVQLPHVVLSRHVV